MKGRSSSGPSSALTGGGIDGCRCSRTSNARHARQRTAPPFSEPEIPAILEEIRAQSLPTDEGVYRVDWAGVRTRIPMLPWAPQEFAGTTDTELPIPSDGYRSEAEE